MKYRQHIQNFCVWLLFGSVLVASLVYLDRTQNGPVEAKPTDSNTSLMDCRETRYSDICQTTQIQGETVRYGLSAGTEDITILVDTGGPGLSVLNDHFPSSLRESLPEPLNSANLVFVEERWVTKPLGAECEEDIKQYYSDLRSADLAVLATDRKTKASETLRFAKSCDLQSWSWTPQQYAQTVSNIEKESEVDFDGFIGFSFGTNRYEYLKDDNSFEWAWLLQPAPPTRTAENFISNRSETLIEVFQENCGDNCSSPNTFETQFSDALGKFDNQAIPLPERSVDVTDFDLMFTIYGLGNTKPELWSQIPAILDDPSSHPESIAALSDSVWSRIGSDGLSPAHLGYLSEVCGYYKDWESAQLPTTNTAKSFWILHQPCIAVEATNIPQSTPPKDSSQEEVAVCISGSTRDPISSTRSIQELVARYDKPTVKSYDSLGHDSAAALAECATTYT